MLPNHVPQSSCLSLSGSVAASSSQLPPSSSSSSSSAFPTSSFGENVAENVGAKVEGKPLASNSDVDEQQTVKKVTRDKLN